MNEKIRFGGFDHLMIKDTGVALPIKKMGELLVRTAIDIMCLPITAVEKLNRRKVAK